MRIQYKNNNATKVPVSFIGNVRELDTYLKNHSYDGFFKDLNSKYSELNSESESDSECGKVGCRASCSKESDWCNEHQEMENYEYGTPINNPEE